MTSYLPSDLMPQSLVVLLMNDDKFKAHPSRAKELFAMEITEIWYEMHEVATCRCGVGYTDALLVRCLYQLHIMPFEVPAKSRLQIQNT